MQRTRVKLSVFVDLDPVPGYFHSKESAQNGVRGILQRSIPQYAPLVSFEEIVQAEEANVNQPQLDLFPVDFAKESN